MNRSKPSYTSAARLALIAGYAAPSVAIALATQGCSARQGEPSDTGAAAALRQDTKVIFGHCTLRSATHLERGAIEEGRLVTGFTKSRAKFSLHLARTQPFYFAECDVFPKGRFVAKDVWSAGARTGTLEVDPLWDDTGVALRESADGTAAPRIPAPFARVLVSLNSEPPSGDGDAPRDGHQYPYQHATGWQVERALGLSEETQREDFNGTSFAALRPLKLPSRAGAKETLLYFPARVGQTNGGATLASFDGSKALRLVYAMNAGEIDGTMSVPTSQLSTDGHVPASARIAVVSHYGGLRAWEFVDEAAYSESNGGVALALGAWAALTETSYVLPAVGATGALADLLGNASLLEGSAIGGAWSLSPNGAIASLSQIYSPSTLAMTAGELARFAINHGSFVQLWNDTFDAHQCIKGATAVVTACESAPYDDRTIWCPSLGGAFFVGCMAKFGQNGGGPIGGCSQGESLCNAVATLETFDPNIPFAPRGAPLNQPLSKVVGAPGSGQRKPRSAASYCDRGRKACGG